MADIRTVETADAQPPVVPSQETPSLRKQYVDLAARFRELNIAQIGEGRDLTG